MAYEYYTELPIEEHEAVLANRKFWDCYSSEWENATIEKKLIPLALFVQRGGKLNRVINKYADGREYTYRKAIQYSVIEYIEKLLGTDDYYLRIIQLDKREVLQLLTELLKAGVVKDYVRDSRSNSYRDEYRLTENSKNDDSLLTVVEERHKRVYPNETIEQKRRRAERWIGVGSIW